MDILKDKIWLVKVPEIIYNQMLNQKDIGYMDIYETAANNVSSQQNPKKEILVNLGEREDNIKFDLNYDKTDNFFLFKDKKNKIRKINHLGRFVASDESVSDKVTMNVAKDELTNKPSIAIEYGKGRPITHGIIPISEHQFYATSDNYQRALSRMNRKEKHLKKTRMDKEELKKEIFNLFTEKDYWTNKELVAKLDQPEIYLKEVLSEMCNPIRSGPKKGCYQLKPQYIRSTEQDNEREGFSDLDEDDNFS